MLPEKMTNEKLGQIKEAVWTSWRLTKLVWGVDHWLFTGNVLATTIPAIIPFINFYIYKLVIDFVVAAVSTPTPLDYQHLYFLIGLRVVTYFVQDASFRTQDFLGRLFWTKVPITLNHQIFSKISSLDMEYFENSRFKDLLEKVRDSYAFRPQQLMENLFMGFQSFVQLLIAFVAISRLNWFLVFLIAAVAIPEFILQTQISRLSWGIWAQNSPFRKRFWYLAELLQQATTIKEIKIFRLAKKFLDEVYSIQQKFYQDNSKLARKNYSINLIFNGLSTAVFIGVEVFVVFQALTRRITIGDINFYTGVVSNFQNGLGGLFRNMRGIFENSLYVKSIFEVLDTEPIVKIAARPTKIFGKNAPVIEFKNIYFAYPDTKKKVLQNFSLKILPGEKIAFVGENGAGKSTIIKLLARFYDVNRGEILINGHNLKDVDLESWYRMIGILFQDFNHYEHTARENIEFGRIFETVNLSEVVSAAMSSGAHQVIDKLDKGYEQMLGKTFESGVELSVGQWQKVALARAFLRNAPILVLDEPTASIDAKAEAEIFNKVEKLSKNKTIIIISHRFSTVRNAGKIYVIDNGKIVESGSHNELMALNGQYATMFKLQAKGYQ